MAKLTIIVGIAGSGKSALRKEIAGNRNIKGFGDGTLVKCEPRRAGFDCLGEMVARLLGRQEDCVMDESHLTMRHFRDLFKEFCDQYLPGVQQEWIFFERNVIACINNIYHDMYVRVKERDLLSRLKALKCQGKPKAYEVPAAGEYPGHQAPHPVYRQESPKFTDEQEAMHWLQGEITRLGEERGM